MKKLVAFYSRNGENYFAGEYKNIDVGNTEKVAMYIAETIGADVFKIEQKQPYSSNYKECIAQAKEDFKNNARPELKNLPATIDDYDEIYLGYPNYCGTMPMAVYSFLENYNFSGKTIHPFCTHEGSGLSGTENDIRKTAKGAEVAKGLAVYGGKADSSLSSISNWVNK